MVFKTIDLDSTHLTLEELLSELDANPEILLTRGVSPVAKVAAAETPVRPKERILGLHEGQGWMSEDFSDEIYDALWDKTFADTQDLLDRLADEAHEDYVAGRTEDFDPDAP